MMEIKHGRAGLFVSPSKRLFKRMQMIPCLMKRFCTAMFTDKLLKLSPLAGAGNNGTVLNFVIRELNGFFLKCVFLRMRNGLVTMFLVQRFA